MPRGHLAHLSKLSPDKAAELFAQHHIVGLRQRKNGEIISVKHATFGWMKPRDYYSLQKLHDLMPLLAEFIRGGYQTKAWLWSTSIEVFGFSVPIGSALPVIETWNLLAEILREKKDPAMLALRAYALLGPFGDIIQIGDMVIHAVGWEAEIARALQNWAVWATTPQTQGTGTGTGLAGAR